MPEMPRTISVYDLEKLRKLFLEKKITEVDVKDARILCFKLEDVTSLEIANEGGQGADGGWYDFLTLRANGQIVFRD